MEEAAARPTLRVRYAGEAGPMFLEEAAARPTLRVRYAGGKRKKTASVESSRV
jgi:hypothetical protein